MSDKKYYERIEADFKRLFEEPDKKYYARIEADFRRMFKEAKKEREAAKKK